jgi:hypothetical protein
MSSALGSDPIDEDTVTSSPDAAFSVASAFSERSTSGD